MKDLFVFLRLIWDALFGLELRERERQRSQPVPGNASDTTSPARDDRLEPAPAPDSPPLEDYGPATALAYAMRSKGFEVFSNNTEDYNLNILAVRNSNANLDKFACRLYVFWLDVSGSWQVRDWPITTYPGSRYLVEKLLNARGAAILKAPQQCWGVYKLDIHGGRYEALCQRNGPVVVYRDGDRDREFDMLPTETHEGYFGINVHAPVSPDRVGYVAQRVYSSSAGCLVFQAVSDFLEFLEMCHAAEERWGNKFTLSILTDFDIEGDGIGPEEDTESDAAKTFRVGRKIVEFEGRRDPSGNLMVYKLPANDGGGEYEVAGLNSRYHPVILAKLVRMPAEDRESVAAEYIENYTRKGTGIEREFPIRPGTEFFVLDTTFNRGPGGSAWITQNALRKLGFSLALDGKWGPITRDKLAKADSRSPHSIIPMLRKSREEYERSQVGYRANFWRGLVNRWNKASEVATRWNNE